MKISIVTPVYNSEKTISDTILSVIKQTYGNFEVLIQDGCSTDNTLEVIAGVSDPRISVLSEPDNGIYDAINKGIRRATGDVIAILNSDDFYASKDVLERVVSSFVNEKTFAVYGNLRFVSPRDLSLITRTWIAGEFKTNSFRRGWMLPHPTLFIRSQVYQNLGLYDSTLKISADYEIMLRFFYKHNVSCAYLDEFLVTMRVGGVSNSGLSNLFNKFVEDLQVANSYFNYGFFVVLQKMLQKISQINFRVQHHKH